MIPLSPPLDLVIVGGGPGGFFAGITCAELTALATGTPARILILEKAAQPLGKVLVSGGGRCNVTHACFDPALLVEHYPRGGSALLGAFFRFKPDDTIAWFAKHGVELKTESDGRVFPVSDSSYSIADCLQESARKRHIKLTKHSTVLSIEKLTSAGSLFKVNVRFGGSLGKRSQLETLLTRNVLLATGGNRTGFQLAAQLGHHIESPVPSIFSFRIPDDRLAGLSGISFPSINLKLLTEDSSTARIPGLEQSGALLITHWGISGPVVLNLSAWGARWLYDHNYQAELGFNWLYPIQTDQALTTIQDYKRNTSNARQKIISRDLFNHLPQRLWQHLIQKTGIDEQQNWADISKINLFRLVNELTRGRFTICGKGPYKEEFVTCGGVCLDEVDFKTMGSRCAPGVYFAGEVLDIDGLTGGYNFQNAWTTGWIAGFSIAEAIIRNI